MSEGPDIEKLRKAAALIATALMLDPDLIDGVRQAMRLRNGLASVSFIVGIKRFHC
jgi:hypothetical protein